MYKVILNFFFCCFFFFLISPALSAQPTEKAFLKAWESIQKNDPLTLVFEKLAENHYRFKTKKFPFDGELKILSISLDEISDSWIMGAVEVQLVDLPEDFFQKHITSYFHWERKNRLYFNKETRQWLSSDGYAKRRKKQKGNLENIFAVLFSAIYYILLPVLFIFVILFIRRTYKKSDESTKKSFQLNEEANRLLKEILEELRKKG